MLSHCAHPSVYLTSREDEIPSHHSNKRMGVSRLTKRWEWAGLQKVEWGDSQKEKIQNSLSPKIIGANMKGRGRREGQFVYERERENV